MVKRVGSKKAVECKMNLGTHNGIFHCDEVVGVAILEIAHMGTDVNVVRTRDNDVLKSLDIVIDVGGGEFDHHMAGFNKCRPTGEKYASAGLVWQKYGETAIKKVVEEGKISIDDEDVKKIKEEIDKEIIIPVDMEDNGEKAGSHTFSFITQFLPSWMNENPDYDDAFFRVETVASEILKEIIRNKGVQITTEKELKKRFESISDGILEIPAQTMPWTEDVVCYNEENDYKVKFVIFPYPAGGWAAQSVPPSIERKFEQLVPFPKTWAGGNEKTLPEISGIPDAILCHNGRFFARTKTKESIIKMCEIAING